MQKLLYLQLSILQGNVLCRGKWKGDVGRRSVVVLQLKLSGDSTMFLLRIRTRLHLFNVSARGVRDHFSTLRLRPGRFSLKVETETETFGCWYQELRLRLFTMVSNIETETFHFGLKN